MLPIECVCVCVYTNAAHKRQRQKIYERDQKRILNKLV